VSEFMLQQTQTDRVCRSTSRGSPRFPTVQDLASAELADGARALGGAWLQPPREVISTRPPARSCRARRLGPGRRRGARRAARIGPYTARAIIDLRLPAKGTRSSRRTFGRSSFISSLRILRT
jgi:hypothetical protein